MNQNDPPIADDEPSAVQPPAFAARDSTAGPATPAWNDAPPPERRSRRIWLYFAGTFLLGMCTAEPDAGGLAERNGQIVGAGAGMLLMSIVFVSVFLGWRRSTRTKIPGAAFIVALLLVPILGDAAEKEKEEQFVMLKRFADSIAGPVDDSDPPPSRGVDARMLWASRKASEDMAGHYDALARSHDVDVENTPDGWLSAAYLADAAKHPEVATYFTRYQAYVRDADSTFKPLLTERLRARLVQSGLPRLEIEGFMRGAARSTEGTPFPTMLEFTEQALALHTYLVSVDSRVHLDDSEEAATFEREAERLHAGKLIDRLERLGREVEAQQRGSTEQLRELGESMGIKPGKGHLPPPPAEPGATGASTPS
jgi:hypothetical protein